MESGHPSVTCCVSLILVKSSKTKSIFVESHCDLLQKPGQTKNIPKSYLDEARRQQQVFDSISYFVVEIPPTLTTPSAIYGMTT